MRRDGAKLRWIHRETEGIAAEMANFLAYLACRQSDLPCARYSKTLAAYGPALAALWEADRDSAEAAGSAKANRERPGDGARPSSKERLRKLA